ncbi:MAG: ATP-binding protein [Cyclobacteriaceae bacterium]
MKLRTQIFSGFIFILFLTLILAGVSIFYLDNVGQASDRILNENYRTVKAAEELINSLATADQVLAKICLGENYSAEALLQILEKEKSIFSRNLAICKDNISEIGENKLVDDLSNEFRDYEQGIETFKTSSDRADFYFQVLQRKNETLRQSCEALINLNHGALTEKDREVQSLYFNAKFYVFIILIMVLIISGWAVYKIPQYIVQPVLDVTDKIKKIAQGDYEQKIEVDSDSELGALSKAFNVMSVKLKEFEETNLDEIKAQKSRIESIIKSINDGLIILNADKEIILVNGAVVPIVGMAEADLVGNNATLLAQENHVMKELLSALDEVEQQPIRVGEEEETDQKNFIKIEDSEGKQEFFTKEIIDVHDNESDQGRSLGYIILLKDVTYFKKSDEAKTNFIAVASHEFKTPLSAINMCLMLLQDKRFGDLNPEQKEIVGSMKSEVQRLIKMVSELLDISKMETGTIALDKKLVSPQMLIEYSAAPFEVQLNEKNINLLKKIDPEIGEFMADTEKISWVLINFLSNAIRYTAPGEDILVEASRSNGYVEFGVIDHGPGIPEEDLDKVFRRFVQLSTNGHKNEKGLGLGLAISKEVINEHQGEIGVESNLGEGSRFFFRIPLETN